MEEKIIDNENDMVAYCGLFCPKCYNMKVGKAAETLLKEVKLAEEKGAAFDNDHPSFKVLLNNLVDLQCSKFCREGGGKSRECKIRKCCDDHSISGCWHCLEFEKCEKLKLQFKNNIREIRSKGIDEFIKDYK